VNLYSLLVYIEHNGDESPKDDGQHISSAYLHTWIDNESIQAYKPAYNGT